MSSPFSSKLGTNYCPKDEELVEIKNLIIEPTLRLRRLDDEIVELQSALVKLAAERDSVEAFVDAHKALISPARRLPLDIIQEIFVACLPTHRNCVMSASEAPVLLGRICGLWRAISLSTPRLWSKIHVVEPFYWHPSPLLEKKLAQRLETTKIWLERSGQCRLSISLECRTDGNDSSGYLPDHSTSAVTPGAMQFLQALIPSSRRWRHMHFSAPLWMLWETMSHLREADVPLLESVAIYHNFRDNSAMGSLGPLEILRGARISSFATPGNSFVSTLLPLRWQQLTRLTIDGPPWNVGADLNSEAILRTVARCPELRFCRLGINDIENTEVHSQHPVVELPFLHTLELHCVGNMEPTVSFLLERISLPKLRSFTIRSSMDTQYPRSLAPFFARSANLETLEIDSMAFSRASLIESLLGLPPTLRRLGIHNLNNRWGGIAAPPSLADETLAILTPAHGLQDLFINHCIDITDEALLRFVIARMSDPHSMLLRIEVQFDRIMEADILPALKPFIDSGLNVSITHLVPVPVRFSPWHGLSDAPSSGDNYPQAPQPIIW
ncbi:hypothetical protein C8F04DRAFT_1111994 [Mycena alexandri]|uniref:F-box domain-containing protein n=1 Tax=Mycena alexandri TaxID=1745969 RepID=A0AAD6SNH6_9AGAR|nr:hypothetical protein C8F04DRAFT_1111994 [Mycena alexandri]